MNLFVRPPNVTVFGDDVKIRPLRWDLIQSDWYFYKKRKSKHTKIEKHRGKAM